MDEIVHHLQNTCNTKTENSICIPVVLQEEGVVLVVVVVSVPVGVLPDEELAAAPPPTRHHSNYDRRIFIPPSLHSGKSVIRADAHIHNASYGGWRREFTVVMIHIPYVMHQCCQVKNLQMAKMG